MSDKPEWMVRAGRKAAHVGSFREHGVTALGWPSRVAR